MTDKINFAWPITSESGIVYRHFRTTITRYKEKFADKRIVIFGAGIRGCFLLTFLEKDGYTDIVFCDNNPDKQGHLIHHYDIISLKEALDYQGEQVFLVSPENSEPMSRQLLEAGLAKNDHFFSFDFSIYDSYMEEFERPVENHGLFVGDCAFSHIALTDEVTLTFGDMLKAEIGEQRCKVLNVYGIGQRANFNIIQSRIDGGERPKLVVLLVALEVLTSKAHVMPRSQHPGLLRRIVASLPYPREQFIEYTDIAEKRFSQFQVESFASFRRGGEDSNEKLFMKMNYLFKIKEDTEGVTYLKKIIKLMNDEGIPIVLYIPPANYMQGGRFFGDNFKLGYRDNFDRLYRFLDSEGLKYNVLDTSFLLTEEEFAAVNTIDETTNYKGRKKLLKFFSESEHLKSLFS